MSERRNRTREVGLALSAAGLALLIERVIKAITRPSSTRPPSSSGPHPIAPPTPIEPPTPIASATQPNFNATPLVRWWNDHRLEIGIVIGLIVFGIFLWLTSLPPDANPPAHDALPFDYFLGARQWMMSLAPNAGSILIVLAAIVLGVIWAAALMRRRIRSAISASVLIVCSAVALYGQVLLMNREIEPGTVLYLIAAALILIWIIWQKAWRHQPASNISRRTELALIAAVMAVTVFARIYDLKRTPYGVDGDEAIWTIEIVSAKLDQQNALSSIYHFRNLPMSYWMETPFQWALGAGLTSGRIEVAIFSIVATFIFYLLMRELFDIPTALVATVLLAVSLPDLSASRTANIQAHFKIWSVLPLWGIAVAMRTRQVKHFFLTGLAMAGGLMTYESLIPICVVTTIFAVIYALIDWLRHRSEWRAWIKRFAAMFVVAAPAGLLMLGYLNGRGQYYQAFRHVSATMPLPQLVVQGFGGVFRSFYQSPMHDALFSRNGPYINGLLVPLLALGIVLAIGTIKRRGSLIALLWLAWVFIPVPVFLPAPLPRLYYAGLPALYIFIALMLITLYRSVDDVIGQPMIMLPIAAIVLGGIVILNLTIWFQEITTTDEASIRRELAELVAANVDPNSVLLLPHDPLGGDEPVEVEQGTMQLFIRERHGTTDAGEYRLVPIDQLLPTITLEGPRHRTIRVLYDLTQDPNLAHRGQVYDALKRCYPATLIKRTNHFELYQLSGSDIALAACRSTIMNVGPVPNTIESRQPLTVDWSLDSIPASAAALTCWRNRSDLIWYEAETMPQLTGWKPDNAFVANWSGTGYLADDFPGHVEASGTISVPNSGTYSLWIRSYRRRVDDFPLHLEVNGQTYTFAESSIGLNTWVWQKLDTLNLNAGDLPIKLTRDFDRNRAEYFAVFVDAIVLAAEPNYDPNQSDRWLLAFEKNESFADKSTHGTFSISFEPGQYRCQLTARDADRLIDATGTVGVTTEFRLDVQP